MKDIKKIIRFVQPYWKLALLSLITLTVMVFSDLAIPRLVERIVDVGIREKDMQVVLHTSLIMLGIALINTIFAVMNNLFSIRVGENTARDIREALFVKIQQFSYGDLDKYSTGKLMVRLTSDTAAVQRLVQVTLRIGTRAPFMIIGSIILMFVTSTQLAIAMIPVLSITAIVVVIFSAKMEPLFRAVQQKLDHLNTVLQENIAGARLVKAFVRADFETERFDDANEDLTGDSIKVMQYMAAMSPALTVFVNIGMVMVIAYGGVQAIQGRLLVGQIIAFTNYLLTTMTPLILMSNLANTFANGLASAKRVNEILDLQPEVPVVTDGVDASAEMVMRVDFSRVDFHYRGDGAVNVLEQISLNAKPGEMVALLGATGAGKTSLVNLIPRFYDVTAGAVRINGHDVREVMEDTLLNRVGIVPQETILFSGTIRENLCYGKPDATDEEIIAAAKAAQAHEFISSFPNGYESMVEERGANLSGGQKQRIAIARALLTQPQILILDDATSSVDVETETRIQDALKHRMQDCISFVVAQRISTVLNADKIIVLDKGRIVAEGRHGELLQSSPIYREIYASQLGAGINGVENGGAA